jgi:hypothetical protein
MTLGEKQLRELRRIQKKRAERPNPPEAVSTSLRVSPKMQSQFAKRHKMQLYAIEKMILTAATANLTLTDQHVMAALQALITKEPSSDPLAGKLADSIQVARHLDTEDGVWCNALRVVWTSTEFHSSGATGSRRYLRFIDQHLPT